jgi:hypothetical protein
MKTRLQLIAVFACCLALNKVSASETEPNNTSANANTLALNSSNSGAVNPGGDQDWWKVTTSADGKLNCHASRPWVDATCLYTFTTTMARPNSPTRIILAQILLFLLMGWHLAHTILRLSCTNASDTSSYNISNTLTLTGVNTMMQNPTVHGRRR